nr:NAD(P)-binding domain-containing protein [Verrucomicrobiota bacterium]
MKKRLAVIGAGPIGLEAALAAQFRGYEVEVYELGGIADSVRKWGHVRMFSPFGLNASSAGIALLRARGKRVPAPDALLTGAEFAGLYLEPLAANLDLPIHCGAEVMAIGRDATAKTEKIGMPERAGSPFRLLVRQGRSERFQAADLVFDCSGTFRTPNPLGDGGIPAAGESAHREFISYGMPDAGAFAGQRVLVAGGGHSAATAVCDLARLSGTQITWAVRQPAARPCAQIPNDPLPARAALAAAANALARGRIDFRPGAAVETVSKNGAGVEVIFRRAGGR